MRKCEVIFVWALSWAAPLCIDDSTVKSFRGNRLTPSRRRRRRFGGRRLRLGVKRCVEKDLPSLATEQSGAAQLVYVKGMLGHLYRQRVLLKDFGDSAQRVSQQVKDAAVQQAKEQQREVRYLSSSGDRKEDIARQIATDDNVQDGLVCLLTAVEPCFSFDIYRNRQTHRLELIRRQRKCGQRRLDLFNCRQIIRWLDYRDLPLES